MFFIPAIFFALFTVSSFTIDQEPTPVVKAEDIQYDN